jgi:hypothetical protein
MWCTRTELYNRSSRSRLTSLSWRVYQARMESSSAGPHLSFFAAPSWIGPRPYKPIAIHGFHANEVTTTAAGQLADLRTSMPQ